MYFQCIFNALYFFIEISLKKYQNIDFFQCIFNVFSMYFWTPYEKSKSQKLDFKKSMYFQCISMYFQCISKYKIYQKRLSLKIH